MVSAKDKNIIRELATQWMELASLPVMNERKRLWRAVHDLRAERPVILFETGWIEGCPLEYFYTLGLAYFYVDECDRAYPLFNAALQIEPEEPNAIEGIRLCRLSEE